MIQNGVSVIICCHNSAERLPDVLKHLERQKFANPVPWEIIIVDNASTDNTSEVAKIHWKGKREIINVISEPVAGLSNARIAGINKAKYEYLTFIDDDNWVCNDWVERVYSIMNKHSDVAICGGQGSIVTDGKIPEWFNKFHNAFAVGNQFETEGYLDNSRLYLYGAGLSIKKSILNELFSKGFKFLLSGRKGAGISSGEDYELCLATRLLGYKLWYDPNLKFNHVISHLKLNKHYLEKLYISFGKASVILDLYKARVLNYKGLNMLKYNNYLMSLFYSLYWIFKLLFMSPLSKRYYGINQGYFRFLYSWYNFTAKIKSYKRYKKINNYIVNLASDVN